jgi:hypothetical protein
MSPASDLLPGDQKAWALADAGRRTVLIYSYEGSAVTLPPTLAGQSGLWFNPVNGRTVEVARLDAVAAKPDAAGWALLIRQT